MTPTLTPLARLALDRDRRARRKALASAVLPMLTALMLFALTAVMAHAILTTARNLPETLARAAAESALK